MPKNKKYQPLPLSPSKTFTDRARELVFGYAKTRLDKTIAALNIEVHPTFSLDDVYVVWSCKTLLNWKCLVSTTLIDGMYYEVTHNGDKNETYLDAYKKFDNVVYGNGS